jgi:hypothetical protein
MVELVADCCSGRDSNKSSSTRCARGKSNSSARAKESDLGALAPIYGESELFAGHPYGRPSTAAKRASRRSSTRPATLLSRAGRRGPADPRRRRRLQDSAAEAAHLACILRLAQSGHALPPLPKAERVASRRVLLVDAPESVQSYFWAGNVAVAKSDPRRPSLDVTNTLFGGRFTSMLNTELRIRTGLSYSASSRFDRLLQPAHWEMSSFTQTDTTIQALDLMLATLDQLHALGLEPKMVESGKSYVQGQFPLALETSEQWAAQLATLEFYGLDRRYIDDYSQQLGT